jgi:hypothetical protein
MYNRIGVHEAPGLLREGGGVMNKIQSENLSQKPAAAIKQQYPAFLNNGSTEVASCSGRAERGFLMNKKGGEKQFVSDQRITKEEKYIVTLIRRMEVKQ